jgi:hypothetical protein
LKTRLRLEILPQPDDVSCGPTCLHAVYRYYGDIVSLDQLIWEVPMLESGGTLAVLLGCHALRRGYRATIYTYNLQVFDPTWFAPGSTVKRLGERLKAQFLAKSHTPKLRAATPAYLEFLDRGGQLRLEDLTTGLIRRYLRRGRPILTGLSATYLYRASREFGPADDYDDIRGEPSGHFVVLSGYDKRARTVLVSDPTHPNPLADSPSYAVGIDRLVCSILLGILTYDANLLIIEPPEAKRQKAKKRVLRARTHRRR